MDATHLIPFLLTEFDTVPKFVRQNFTIDGIYQASWTLLIYDTCFLAPNEGGLVQYFSCN